MPLPGYNIQSLFRILPQHTVALRCAKALELPQNGFLRGNQALVVAKPPGEKFIKIGGRLVRHARRLVFQLAEVAVPKEVFRQVLERIGGLHPAPG